MLLLECPDYVSRVNISNLLKFVLNTLKEQEKDYLYELKTVVEINNDDGSIVKYQIYKALSSRFIM